MRAPYQGTGVFGYFTHHKTLANLLLVVMLALGVLAATNIRTQYFPDVVISEVTVTVPWPGVGAEDVDRAIVQVLEPALLGVEGVTEVTSRATQGSARLSMQFDVGTDIARATEDVTTALQSIRTLPDGAEDPVVRPGSWRDGVSDIVISGPVGIDQLARLADELSARLFAQGVTKTTTLGVVAPQIVVELPTIEQMRHDITLDQIAGIIAAGVATNPAGDVDAGSRLRTGIERRSAADIADTPIKTLPDGSALTIGDVADVRIEGADRGRASFVGDNPAVTIRVERTAEGDAIRMQQTVQAVVDEMRPGLPQGVALDLIRVRADQITERLWLLWDNALSGLALVVVILFLFLNARTAFWVAAGIPVATLAAVAVMFVSGLTLNMISLFAMILILGVIVDDSIVVSEHAEYRRHVLKEPPEMAAENAARRMAGPVLASTLTTVIAFFGLIAIGGRFGELIADIPFTVIAVMIASLVECFLILPNHLAHALKSAAEERWYDWPSRQVKKGFDWLQDRVMRPFFGWVVVARYPVLAAALLALAFQASLVIKGDVPFRFFDAPEQAFVTGNFSMLSGADRQDTRDMLSELQRAVGSVADKLEAEHGVNPVKFVIADLGGGAGRGLASAEGKDADLLGAISIELVAQDMRPFSSAVFVSALQAEVQSHPLLEELSFRGGRFGPGGDAISVDLYGSDADKLKAAAEALQSGLAEFPEVTGLEDSLSYDKDDLILNLTPRGQALGLSTEDLGRDLRNMLNGVEAASFPDGLRTSTIQVTLPKAELTADFLNTAMVRIAAGQYVPLADVVTVERQPGFSVIERQNGLQVVSVTGDISGDDPERAQAIQTHLRTVLLPALGEDFGVVVQQSGLAQQERDFLGDAGVASILCLMGMYLVLCWVFSSWIRPLVVMSVIPFGLVGAIWGHYIWDVPMSLFSVVGIIGMSGIIVNDSIVLVSTIDEFAERQPVRAAIINAVTTRLRPVFLTTLTTVIGLAPLLYDTSAQSAFLKPTVVTLVYGLGFGMFLVLLVVPAIAAMVFDASRPARSIRRALTASPRRMRVGLWVAVGGMAVVCGGLFAPLILGAQMPEWLLDLFPEGAFQQVMPTLLVYLAFVAVLACVAAIVWGAVALRHSRNLAKA